MQNRTVPAAAEGMPSLTRREAIRTLAAGAATGALAAGVVAAVTPAEAVANDPCLAFLTGWDQAIADNGLLTDEASNARHYDTVIDPFNDAVLEGRIPPATTAKGAAAALRKVIGFNDLEVQDKHLVLAALAYLDGRA